MFDILFGWRKASKCKRLIRKVQCRLKLLKNKRCTIIRMLRDDIAHLLNQGHAHTALLHRVEHVFKDENLVAVYDLLDHFCEFIIINLPYIRRNKDCPNDINEAVSSIIFASARLGELPELRALRKLFGQRYGQHFANVALQLLPGNLVNRQMQEKVCLKQLPNDAKRRFLSEIAPTNFESEPLLIEYSSESQQLLASKTSGDPSLGMATMGVDNSDQNRVDPDINKGEKESVYFEISSEAKRLLKHLAYSFLLRSKIVFPLINLKSDQSSSINSKQSSILSKRDDTPHKALEKAEEKEVNQTLYLTFVKENHTVKSSSSNLPEDTVFLDDIHEFKSFQVEDEGSLKDQRVFMFSPNINNPETEHQSMESAYESDHDQSDESRSFKKSPVSKRLRRKSTIDIPKNVKDVECEMYYGSRNQQKNIQIKQEFVQKSPKISINIINSVEEHHKCSLDHPCYSPTFPKIQCRICYYHQCSCKKKTDIKVKSEDIFSCSKEGCNERKMERKTCCYSRAETMPVERIHNDNYLRSNSFPVEQPLNPHVHPKLPDYDELAAKFTALKKSNLKNQTPPQKRFK